MNFYATVIPSWTYEEIQLELQLICIATAQPSNGYEEWLALWHRINQLDDLRAASDERRTRFDCYASAVFAAMERVQLQ